MAVNYRKCPKCGSCNSVKIVYGMPSFKLFQEAEAGKVKLGGCCIIEGGPEYHCKDCNNEWNRVEIITDGRTVRKYGDNKFPEEWKQFCKMIKRITGKEFR